jgi:hypothetical protein
MVVVHASTARAIYRRVMRLSKEIMPDVIIVAIARICDEAQLEEVLTQCAGLEASHLTLFTIDSLREAPARSRMHFVPFRGSPVASGSNGTNVPGLDSTLALSAYLVDASSDHLRDIGISDEAAHYYNIAIDEGRGVVTYVTSTRNATSIEEQFRACGFVKIRRFPLPEKVSVKVGR